MRDGIENSETSLFHGWAEILSVISEHRTFNSQRFKQNFLEVINKCKLGVISLKKNSHKINECSDTASVVLIVTASTVSSQRKGQAESIFYRHLLMNIFFFLLLYDTFTQ